MYLILTGLQNQCTGDELVGGFDSHALPPIITIISISYLNITPLKGRRWDVDKGVMSFFS